eukprot:1145609-Pelagomonas_calceolata.AAC.2
MGLEEAKTFGTDIYVLIEDFTSGFYGTDHDRMLWIMYDLGFPTDAINVYRDIVKKNSGRSILKVPVEKGGRSYKHSCIPGQNATDTHLAN